VRCWDESTWREKLTEGLGEFQFGGRGYGLKGGKERLASRDGLILDKYSNDRCYEEGITSRVEYS
jgi:hypothetical protein